MVIQKSSIARFQAAWNLALWQPILMLSMTLDAFLNYGAACNWQTLMLRAYWHTKVAKYFIRKNGSSPNHLYWNQKSYHFGDSSWHAQPSLTKFGGFFCLWTSSPPNEHDFCFQYWWFELLQRSLEPFLLMKILATFFECKYKLKITTDVCKILVHLTQNPEWSDRFGAHFDALPISLAAA